MRPRRYNKCVLQLARVGLGAFLLCALTPASLTGCAQRPAKDAPAADGDPSAAKTLETGDVHLSVREIVRLAAKSVVVVRTPYGIGTGFVVEPGLVATNLHVIAGADRMGIAGSDGKPRLISAVVAADPEHDLALVAFEPTPTLPPLPLGRGKDLVAGDPVVALGTPGGLALSASSGIVSAVRTVTPTITLVQTTAPISPGSSGGPLLDDGGRVVAVTTLFSKNGQNLNFAVPVEYVSELMENRPAPLSLPEFAKKRWSGVDSSRTGGSASALTSDQPFPQSVAGFRLGSRVEDAAQVCPSRFEVRKSNSAARCGIAAVDVPFAEGPVDLYFMRERMVGVVLFVSSLHTAEKALTTKYGAPAREKARLVWRLDGGMISLNPPQTKTKGKASMKYAPFVIYSTSTDGEPEY
jgi:S1-C subfamily serine protease